MADPLLAIADELYGLPLADFTAARDALAKQRRAEKPVAAAIKGLRKATLAAWVVNLLVRRDPEQVAQVLSVGAALREAQDSLNAAQLRDLTRQRRQVSAAVTTSARRLAREEGVKVTPSVADQVEGTITAAMLDSEAAKAVRSGMLVNALQATGLDDLDLSGAVAIPGALGFKATARVAPGPDPTSRPQLRVVPDPDAEAKARQAADERLAEAESALAAATDEERAARCAVDRMQAKNLQLRSEIAELGNAIAVLESDLEEVDDELSEAECERMVAEEVVARTRSEVETARSARARLT